MKQPFKIQNHPEHPFVIFDGDCDFCRFWILRWQAWTGDAVDYEPLQSPSMRERFPELPREALEEALHLILPDGRVYSGAEAVFRALGGLALGRGLVWCYESLPGVAPLSEAAYRVVANHRPFFSFWTRLLWGLSSGLPRFEVSTRWFLRGLAMIYIVAFWSLGVQINGLVGSHGLEPVTDLMQAARRELGGASLQNFHLLPTLCWWNDSDGFLKFQWAAGVGLAWCALLGFFQGPALLLLWALYLSLTTACGDFLGFQWDALLLETGLLAVWLASWKPWLRWNESYEPPRLARWLLWWLLFRLTFLSGCVKLLSGDEAWRNLTALNYHYQTQPLPTFLAWYAQHFPASVQKWSTIGMFFIELALPFAIVLPRRARHAAALGLILLQVIIMLTGNYTFFNFLTIALVLLLFDDSFLLRFKGRARFLRAETSPATSPASRYAALPSSLPAKAPTTHLTGLQKPQNIDVARASSPAGSGGVSPPVSNLCAATPTGEGSRTETVPKPAGEDARATGRATPRVNPAISPCLVGCFARKDEAPPGSYVTSAIPRTSVWPARLRLATLFPLACVIGLITVWEIAGAFGKRGTRIPYAQDLAVWASPFRSVNSYGLFAVMTKTRDEIIIEGSADGGVWREYEFPYKPGDVKRRPAFVAPYQPRLDWQMWFAALGSYRQNPWFSVLMVRLLQGTPEVLALFEKNPFPAKPPQFIRARLYEYRFTTPSERSAGEGWWHREAKGIYFPLLSLSMISGKPA